MTDQRAWFVYARPHAGKISARPIHPIGWILLLAVPIPATVFALVVAPVADALVTTLGSLAVTGMALWTLFGIVIWRGIPADIAD